MSSPTQLPHLFVGETRAHAQMDDSPHRHNNNHMLLHDHMSPSGYEELDFASELPDFSYDHSSTLDMGDTDSRYHVNAGLGISHGQNGHFLASHSQHPAPNTNENGNGAFVKGHSKHFSVDGYLQTPFTLNAGSRFNFHHLRNVSLDDNNYRMQMATPSRPRNGPGHSHSMSLTLNSADPPSGTFSHSVSTSTFGLMDLVPQLSLLMSNKLLLDSPYSSMGAGNGNGVGSGACGASTTATTPGRRKLSTSLSSNNLYTTPLRGSVGQSPNVKVAKSLVSHRRNRLRASLEPGSSLLLASIANMKTSTTVHAPSHSQFHAAGHSHNPFESTLLSPEMGNMDDYEATPLHTPGNNSVSSMYFTPIGHNQNFGGSLQENSNFAPQAGNFHPLPRMAVPQHEAAQAHFSFRPGPALARNDTFELLPIEDQEDDACKQLRKSKSFTASTDARQMLSRSASMRNMNPHGAHAHAQSPLIGNEQASSSRSFHNSASVDLLLPQVLGHARTSALKSYPASIDLASITKLGMNQSATLPSAQNNGLLPPLPAVRSSSSVPALSNTHLSELPLFTNLATKKTSATYPNASQIQEVSTTEEIAKFAERILNSDLKRPIVMHEESVEVHDPKKKHKCPLCFARFQRPEHVKRHMKSHSSEKPFQCDMPDCGRRFNRKDNLKAHLKKIHGKTC